MIEPETIIDGRYRVISRLGSGGMADVYLAQDQLLGREVAVKVLHHHFSEDQEFVERFRREASSAAALSHPNIVGIFDRGEWNGTYYIAMEYVAGRTLKSLVRESGPIDPALAIGVVEQILRAAQFAHRRGVIHRDLKPHNVIVDEEGRVRVTDFGIARAGASDMTLTGSIMGTAQYLSPEQAQGYAVSAASDIYSVGVILYELLTGVVPFEGETAVAIAYKQVSAAPRAPSEVNPALPASLDAVVLRALAKDPADRYADGGELIAALEHERRALPASSGAPAAVVGAPAHAPPPLPATGSLLLAPLGAEGYPLEEERRTQRWLWWASAAALLVVAAVLALLLLQPSSDVTVPGVVGQGEQAAVAHLRKSGFVPVTSNAASATVATGVVASQSPSAGASAKKGARVQLVVSSGPSSAALPSVEGLSTAQAQRKLAAAGFRTVSSTQASTSVPAGHVISTNPPAGTELQSASTVALVVSSGPAPVRAPDVTGETRSAAESTLKNANLTVGNVTERVSASAPAGTVVAQSPAGGSSLHAGNAVNLTVAKASNEAAVPNVVGKSEPLASAALGEAGGFVPRTRQQVVAEEAKVGTVLAQHPAAGTRLRKGAAVTITVGIAPPTSTTPTTPTTPAPATTPAPTPPTGG